MLTFFTLHHMLVYLQKDGANARAISSIANNN